MSIIAQSTASEELSNSILSFFSEYKIGEILRKCNGQKEKGVPSTTIFKYKMCNVFSDRSLYMQLKTKSFRESFSKNAFYRFLNSPKTNWLRFTTMLSKKVADSIEKLTDEKRVNCFIIDDSLFERTSCKATELGSRVFDHCSMKFKLGYRLMTLGWTDGDTFLPVNSCLLASSKASNIIGTEKHFDGRTLAGQRRTLAQKKAPDAMLDLIRTALSNGLKANYVLFDTWFSAPSQLISIKGLGLDAIAMVKKTSKIHYSFNGEKLSLNKIYGMSKKNRGRSKILLSADVLIGPDENQMPAKIVFVRNNRNKKEWIAFICTDTTLDDKEIVRIYGKRWQIEVFFKMCKSRLNLVGECHSLSYDALTAHVAIVFTRYLLIAMTQRSNNDLRTLGEIFFFLADEMADITFAESLYVLMTSMLKSMFKFFTISEDQIQAFVYDFVSSLPEYLQNALAATPTTV